MNAMKRFPIALPMPLRLAAANAAGEFKEHVQ
jgi:hypothetical protein